MHQTFREENASFQENLGEPRKSLFISIFNRSFCYYFDKNFEKGFWSSSLRQAKVAQVGRLRSLLAAVAALAVLAAAAVLAGAAAVVAGALSVDCNTTMQQSNIKI